MRNLANSIAKVMYIHTYMFVCFGCLFTIWHSAGLLLSGSERTLSRPPVACRLAREAEIEIGEQLRYV